MLIEPTAVVPKLQTVLAKNDFPISDGKEKSVDFDTRKRIEFKTMKEFSHQKCPVTLTLILL